MDTHPKQRRSGFTLVELLVVLAVVALLAAVAIPTFARLGPGSRDEVSNTSQTVFSLIKAARIYAATHRTDAAVVYVLDNYRDPPVPAATPVAEPYFDTIRNRPVRIIRGAAVVAKNRCGFFEPIPRAEGQFIEFGNTACILLQATDHSGQPLIDTTNVRFPGVTEVKEPALRDFVRMINTTQNESVPPAFPLIEPFGMRLEAVIIASTVTGPDNTVLLGADPCAGNADITAVTFPAHVFSPAGVLQAGGKERYTIHVGYTPDLAPEERVVNPGNLTSELQTTPIHLYRTTGRVRIAS